MRSRSPPLPKWFKFVDWQAALILVEVVGFLSVLVESCSPVVHGAAFKGGKRVHVYSRVGGVGRGNSLGDLMCARYEL